MQARARTIALIKVKRVRIFFWSHRQAIYPITGISMTNSPHQKRLKKVASSHCRPWAAAAGPDRAPTSAMQNIHENI